MLLISITQKVIWYKYLPSHSRFDPSLSWEISKWKVYVSESDKVQRANLIRCLDHFNSASWLSSAYKYIRIQGSSKRITNSRNRRSGWCSCHTLFSCRTKPGSQQHLCSWANSWNYNYADNNLKNSVINLWLTDWVVHILMSSFCRVSTGVYLPS